MVLFEELAKEPPKPEIKRLGKRPDGEGEGDAVEAAGEEADE